MNTEDACPSCGGVSFEGRGAIPAGTEFGGQRLAQAMPGGVLVACFYCALVFRSPRPEKHTLDALYRSVPATQWSEPTSYRQDFAFAKKVIDETLPAGSVLDVGCFDGAFLDLLGDTYERFGIEINESAAAIARSRGISIVGTDFAETRNHGARYDVVVSIDSIEHTLRPLDFLRDLSSLIEAGGWIVISTGNSEAPSWRRMGGRYWYCALPEHHCFANRKWVGWAAQKLGLEIINVEYFSHSTPRFWPALRQFTANFLYRHGPSLFGLARRAKQSAMPTDVPPPWSQARDHMIVLFRKL